MSTCSRRRATSCGWHSAVPDDITAAAPAAIAVASAKRNPQLPHVPTLTESGVKGVEMSAWYGLYMPTATPKAVQERVQAEVAKLKEGAKS